MGVLVGEPVYNNLSVSGGVDNVVNSIIQLDEGRIQELDTECSL